MFNFYLEIPLVSIRTSLMNQFYERLCFTYIRWHIRIWKWYWELDWGKSRREIEDKRSWTNPVDVIIRAFIHHLPMKTSKLNFLEAMKSLDIEFSTERQKLEKAISALKYVVSESDLEEAQTAAKQALEEIRGGCETNKTEKGKGGEGVGLD